jgi:hypothetical protein
MLGNFSIPVAQGRGHSVGHGLRTPKELAALVLRIHAGTVTPRQTIRLSGVISCSGLGIGTAVGGEPLHRG